MERESKAMLSRVAAKQFERPTVLVDADSKWVEKPDVCLMILKGH